jgi:hypothetical protein
MIQCRFKFVEIMALGGQVGLQWGTPFLHVFILEKKSLNMFFSRTRWPVAFKLDTNYMCILA